MRRESLVRLGRRTRALGCALALFGAGCGEEPAVPLSARRILLEPGHDAVAPPAPAVVQRYLFGGENPKVWRARAEWSAEQEVPIGSEGEYATGLVAVDPKRRLFTNSGEFEASRINEVQLVIECGGLQHLEVSFLRAGKVVAAAPKRDLPICLHPTSIVVAMPAAPQAEKADELRLEFTGEEPRVALFSVVLASRSPSAFAPHEGEPEFVSEAGEGRNGVWITPGRDFVAKVRLGAAPQLAYSFFVPTRARRNGGEARLKLSVSGSTQVESRESVDFAPGETWREHKLDLLPLADQEVEVRFSMEVGKDVDAACAVANVWALDSTVPPKPSILFVTSDTHRAEYLGISNMGVEVATPALDELARRGVFFGNCWSSTNTTNPSHIALMTGVSPRDTGIHDQETPLSSEATTLAELLRGQGYATWAAVSARHLGPATSGLGQGFDRFAWPDHAWQRRADETVSIVRRWLEESESKPVFLWLHVFDAHFPYEPPDEFDRRYYAGGDPYDAGLPDPRIPERMKTRQGISGLKDLGFGEAQYRGEISYLDSQLAPILALPRFRDGVTVMTADHGESLGDHNVLWDHAELNMGTLHVPLILAWPGAPHGTRSQAAIVSTDIGRTLLDLVGLDRVEFPGTDLRQSLQKADESVPRFAIATNLTEASVTLREKHLILHLCDHDEEALFESRKRHAVELYDLNVDPACRDNRVESDPETAKRLRAAVIRWLQDAKPLHLAGSRSENAELIRDLRKLGYTTGSTRTELWEPDDCAWCKRFE